MTEDLRIDDKGHVAARSDRARALLGEAQGPWLLLDAAPDLFFLLRDEKEGLWPLLRGLGSDRAVLAGSLSEMEPSDLLNFLHQGKRTGVLLTRSGHSERGIALIDGNVAWACSTGPGERLGEMLVKGSLVERRVVDEALAEQRRRRDHPDAGQSRLGKLLEERGALGPEGMARALRQQVVEIFLGLLVLKSGIFLFLRGCDAEKLPARLGLDTQALLLDGLRRLDEMELLRGKLPSLSVRLKATGKAPPAKDDGVHFTAEARQLLALLNGKRLLGQAASEAALPDFDATKAACRLLEGAWAVVVPEKK
ncbi:MAG: hypothetical protein NVSMB23_27340 [Myxococcales bacterium]